MLKIKPKRLSGEESDETIVAWVLEGDLGAFQPIVARYERKLLSYLTRLIGNRDEADDIVQDVFVKAYQHLGSFDRTRKFSSWIYRIAHNEGANWLRKKSRRPMIAWGDIMTAGAEAGIVDDAETAEEAWIRQELRDDVGRALQRLRVSDREILALRFSHDKSYREIADIAGIPMNTVATRLNRAKKRLLGVLSEK